MNIESLDKKHIINFMSKEKHKSDKIISSTELSDDIIIIRNSLSHSECDMILNKVNDKFENVSFGTHDRCICIDGNNKLSRSIKLRIIKGLKKIKLKTKIKDGYTIWNY